MRIADCISSMSKLYLTRIVDSFIKESIPKGDEERLRQQILENADELADIERIADNLALTEFNRSMRILITAILQVLLERHEVFASEGTIFDRVHEYEKSIINKANAEDAFTYSDASALDIYRTVLEVALQDDMVTEDEYALLKRLRTKLKLSRLEHRLLEAQLGMFPKKNNELHSADEVIDALKELQTRGILFYCNRAEDGPIVALPEELVPGVKSAIGFEMRDEAQRLLHHALNAGQLRNALSISGLPTSGTKSERSDRLIAAGVKPSEVLDTLSSNELAEICEKLQGVKKSGTKESRKTRIIDYFASLTLKEPEDSEDPRAIYYQYLEEFASRDNTNLYERKLIKKDREMEAGFEEGTRYLFERKLGCELIEFEGTDHADGGVVMKNGDLLLWDNKGKESEYTFPKSHLRQFKRYIRDSRTRVGVFLIIAPEIDDSAEIQAVRLKHESGSDTDVALISAIDLKFIAENWRRFGSGEQFNLELFNTTGILDRPKLEDRMNILL